MSLIFEKIYKVNYPIIFGFMKEKNLDIPNFCKKCKISYAEFGDLLREYKYIDSAVFYKISEFIQVDINKLITRIL